MEKGAEGALVTFARDMLLHRIEAAKESIWLVSPFLTRAIAERICEAAGSGTQQKRFLTALDKRSVQVGVLDPEGLAALHQCGFEIATIRNLHAKASLLDGKWGLIGSGNLTGAGLGGEDGGNAELGVVLRATQVQAAAEIVSRWWNKADPVSAAEIDAYAALPLLPGIPEENGAGPTLGLTDTTALEEILAEDPTTAVLRGYWIKSNYHRHDDEAWWHRSWISDRRKAPYAPGDLIVLYLGKRDGGPGNCPAIVRAESTSELDREFVLAERDIAAADRWPYVTRTSVVADVSIGDGVSLSLIGKSGQSVQGGYCGIDRVQFEQLAKPMRTASLT
jgi:hypothetical protein